MSFMNGVLADEVQDLTGRYHVVKRNQHARRRPRTREEREMERLEDGQHRESEITRERLISTLRHPSSNGRNTEGHRPKRRETYGQRGGQTGPRIRLHKLSRQSPIA